MPHESIQTLLNANEEWSQSIIKDSPTFFTQLAIGQNPKVCPSHTPPNPIYEIEGYLRSFGLAAPTHECRNQSSQHLSQVIFSYTETLRSTYTNNSEAIIAAHNRPYSQFHLNDDSALSVLTYAVKAVGVEHGEFLTVLMIRFRFFL